MVSIVNKFIHFTIGILPLIPIFSLPLLKRIGSGKGLILHIFIHGLNYFH